MSLNCIKQYFNIDIAVLSLGIFTDREISTGNTFRINHILRYLHAKMLCKVQSATYLFYRIMKYDPSVFYDEFISRTWCVEIMISLSSVNASVTSLRNSDLAGISSPLVGSSKMRTLQFVATAKHNTTFFF